MKNKHKLQITKKETFVNIIEMSDFLDTREVYPATEFVAKSELLIRKIEQAGEVKEKLKIQQRVNEYYISLKMLKLRSLYWFSHCSYNY